MNNCVCWGERDSLYGRECVGWERVPVCEHMRGIMCVPMYVYTHMQCTGYLASLKFGAWLFFSLKALRPPK